MELLPTIMTGTLLGLSAGLAPGPLLTLVIAQTVRHNTKEGLKVSMAPLLTDLPIILIAVIILKGLSHLQVLLGAIACLGGLYVLYLAYDSFNTKPTDLKTANIRPNSLRKGLVVNFMNPQPYLFWITVGAPLVWQYHADHPLAPWMFMGTFYMLLVGSKMILALGVGKSKALLSGPRYLFVMRALGCALVIFALVLFRDALSLWGII